MFTLMLFVLEPLILHRAMAVPDLEGRTFARMERAHRILVGSGIDHAVWRRCRQPRHDLSVTLNRAGLDKGFGAAMGMARGDPVASDASGAMSCDGNARTKWLVHPAPA